MRTVVAAAVACLSVVGLSVAADVQASIKRDISIPAGGLGPALRALSEERHIHVVFISEDVNKLLTRGARGTLTVDEALSQLLNGTGLSFKYIDDETVSIVPVATPPAATRATDEATDKSVRSGASALGEGLAANQTGGGSREFWQRFRLAQAETDSPSNEQISGRSRASADGTETIQEIIVTAQKRMERLQDVPISISVLNGAELDRSVGRGLNDELIRVPGVSVVEGGQTGGSLLNIRGVGAPSNILFGASPIAFYMDSVPFGFIKTAVTPNVSPYDLERVEVVRGPQGTLYGASAQNGVVRVLTQDADLRETEFKFRTDAGNTQYGGMNYRADAAFNLPLVQNKLAARAVIGYQDESGWIDTAHEDESNDGEILNARLRLNARPTEELTLGLSAWLSRSSFDRPNTGNDDRFSRTTVEEPIDVDYDTFSVNVGYEFSSFSVSSATSYIDYTIDSRRESPAPIPVFPLPFPGNNVLTTNLDARVFAEEINLSSNSTGQWRWSLGAMYREATETLFQLRRNPITGGFGGTYLAPTHAEDTSESHAVFGELTRLFWNGRFELTGGVRYFEDEVTLEEKSRLTFPGGIPPTGLVHARQEFDATSPRVVLTWHATDLVTTYASYSEGFRSGFTQSSSVLAVDPNFRPAEPDNLTNYEMGAKGELLGGGLSFDIAVYYMDWQDVQTPLLVNAFGLTLPATVNGTSASGAGLDIALTARPIEGLTLSGSYSVNDLTQDEAVISSGVLVFVEGERLSQSPKYTAAASADYVFPLGAGGLAGRLSVSGNYVSERFQRLLARGTPFVAEPLLLGRGAFSVESPKGWTTTLYVDNLTNEQDSVQAVNPTQPDFDPRIRPRTVGLQVDYRFGR